MSILSLPFLGFLAILFIIYYAIPKRFQWVVLLAGSILFYISCGDWKACVFILVTIVTTFYGARRMDQLNAEQKQVVLDAKNAGTPMTREQKKEVKAAYQKRTKRILVLTLLLNFGILAVLKYGNFVMENVRALFPSAMQQDTGLHLLLPLGISFYTFQTMGYLIDVYRGKYAAEQNILHFGLFASFFPQMIQGPIGRYDLLADQLKGEHSFDAVRFRQGLMRMLWGYFKKMVIADRMAIMVNSITGGFAENGYSGITIFVGVLLYGVQMYADFSGGMDIVFGASDLFGISMYENFRQPYMSRTVSEFWQRWHISLGHWMRDYVFYPIALSKTFAKMQKNMKKKIGNYYGKVIPSMFASFIVFLLVGIWHGAAWRYVIYGTYHAILTSADTFFEKFGNDSRRVLHIDGESVSWKLFQMGRTLVLVTFGRYFDCTDAARKSLQMLKATFAGFNPWVFTDGTFLNLGLKEWEIFFLILMIVLLGIVDVVNERGTKLRVIFAEQGIVFRWIIYFLAIFLIIRLGIYGPGYNASDFIYQGF
ncbi:MAG: MBOAT family protein [Eubacterium sp.]|nr:MBOAT family protein [Eubacterium sp.]